MKHLLLLTISLSFLILKSQQNLNMALKGNLTYPGKDLSDIWGYADSSGNEYALVGVYDGTSIVSLTGSPTELFFIPGASTIWRDLKTHEHYAYVTNEGGNGLLIINMQDLPNNQQNYDWTGGSLGLSTSHNLYIDSGYAYIFGSNIGNGGALILDLSDPWNPVHVGTFDDYYIHDGYVRNDTLWAANINDGHFSIIDVSDKTNPVEIVNQTTPVNFAHNCWLSDDSKYIFVTEEKPGAPITSYDISDPNNITELDQYFSSLSENVIPHNTHVLGDFIINSHYRDGITVVDISKPDNMVEVAYYDTSPQFAGSGFNGSWGAYPFLPSGNILATDIENGLFVLEAQLIKGCYLEGSVYDSTTNLIISGVSIEILSTNIVKQNKITGEYKTGYASSGIYDIAFSKPGYYTKTYTGIVLQNDSLTLLDAKLKPYQTISFDGLVVDANNLQPIADAQIILVNDTFNYNTKSDSNGLFDFPSVFPSSYQIIAGKWGYKNKLVLNGNLNINLNNQTIELEKGIYDDYSLDYGWIVSGTATYGVWEKDKPYGTYYNAKPMNPNNDIQNDIGGECLITGNKGTAHYDDDIDDGYTRITSPVFDLTEYTNPYLSFKYWFKNDGGQGTPINDYLLAGITNGNDSMVIFNTSVITNDWDSALINLNNTVDLNDQMQIYFVSEDVSPGHLVEAGIDVFMISDSSSAFIKHGAIEPKIKLQSNIFKNHISFIANDISLNQTINIRLYNLQGQIAFERNINNENTLRIPKELIPGIYLLSFEINGQCLLIEKVLKRP